MRIYLSVFKYAYNPRKLLSVSSSITRQQLCQVTHQPGNGNFFMAATLHITANLVEATRRKENKRSFSSQCEATLTIELNVQDDTEQWQRAQHPAESRPPTRLHPLISPHCKPTSNKLKVSSSRWPKEPVRFTGPQVPLPKRSSRLTKSRHINDGLLFTVPTQSGPCWNPRSR